MTIDKFSNINFNKVVGIMKEVFVDDPICFHQDGLVHVEVKGFRDSDIHPNSFPYLGVKIFEGDRLTVGLPGLTIFIKYDENEDNIYKTFTAFLHHIKDTVWGIDYKPFEQFTEFYTSTLQYVSKYNNFIYNYDADSKTLKISHGDIVGEFSEQDYLNNKSLLTQLRDLKEFVKNKEMLSRRTRRIEKTALSQLTEFGFTDETCLHHVTGSTLKLRFMPVEAGVKDAINCTVDVSYKNNDIKVKETLYICNNEVETPNFIKGMGMVTQALSLDYHNDRNGLEMILLGFMLMSNTRLKAIEHNVVDSNLISTSKSGIKFESRDAIEHIVMYLGLS